MLSHLGIPVIKPTCSWCMIFLLCCWIWFASILLWIFASVFIREVGLYFSSLVVSLSGFANPFFKKHVEFWDNCTFPSNCNSIEIPHILYPFSLVVTSCIAIVHSHNQGVDIDTITVFIQVSSVLHIFFFFFFLLNVYLVYAVLSREPTITVKI